MLIYLRSCSNIEWRSLNKTYLNIIEIEASYFDRINLTKNWLEYDWKISQRRTLSLNNKNYREKRERMTYFVLTLIDLKIPIFDLFNDFESMLLQKLWIFSQKIWIWEGVRREFGLRLTAKLQIPQNKLPPNFPPKS